MFISTFRPSSQSVTNHMRWVTCYHCCWLLLGIAQELWPYSMTVNKLTSTDHFLPTIWSFYSTPLYPYQPSHDPSTVKSPACHSRHVAYPTHSTIAGSISRLELLRWFQEGKRIGKDFVLVDLRRTDFEVYTALLLPSVYISNLNVQGGTIRGSLNLPAQSLYPTIPTLYSIISQGRIANVVWYCGRCNLSFSSKLLTAHKRSRFFSRSWGACCHLVCRIPGRAEEHKNKESCARRGY